MAKRAPVNTATKAMEGATYLTSEGGLPGKSIHVKLDMDAIRRASEEGRKKFLKKNKSSDRTVRVNDCLVVHIHDASLKFIEKYRGYAIYQRTKTDFLAMAGERQSFNASSLNEIKQNVDRITNSDQAFRVSDRFVVHVHDNYQPKKNKPYDSLSKIYAEKVISRLRDGEITVARAVGLLTASSIDMSRSDAQRWAESIAHK